MLEYSYDAYKPTSKATVKIDSANGGYMPKEITSAWVPDAGSNYYPGTLPAILFRKDGESIDTKFPAYLVQENIKAKKA